MKPAVVNLLQFIYGGWTRLRVLSVILLASLLLSGCVQYDVGVKFEGQHHGKIVQHIKLGEQLTSFSNAQAQDWLRSIERRAGQLKGKTKRLSNQEIIVTVPFSNGAELSSKFNQFFNPNLNKDLPSNTAAAVDLPKFDSTLRLDQGNFFFWQRNHLSYDLDLRSLGVLSANGNVIVSPGSLLDLQFSGSLLDLQFSLETPWGARVVQDADNPLSPQVYDDGHQLVWALKPGQVNHLEAIFWLPSPLGFGTVVIVLLVLGGFYFKYKSFPWATAASTPPTTLSKA